MSQTFLRRNTATSSIIASGNSFLQTARRRIGNLFTPPSRQTSPIRSRRSYEATTVAYEVIEKCKRLIALGREDVLDAIHVDIELENAIVDILSAETMSREIAQAVETEHVHPKTPPLHMTRN